ncbi:hypothetical protein ACUN7V_15675 [Quadrisphaera oryzae]|uniref:hypothetical protein n=1 Tax=Quadrisphaera TaxID=317661 RepID=UPI00164660E6|nr:hypothetical protein [Quadrisphaera sp. RL12-1S]MBC3763984.1 hypothetical protein [Quadrisphaera sp. RL12-1S]
MAPSADDPAAGGAARRAGRRAGRTSRRSTLLKLLGVAGLAGVVATGAVVARDTRRRQQLTPDQVRARLHERHAELGAEREG